MTRLPTRQKFFNLEALWRPFDNKKFNQNIRRHANKWTANEDLRQLHCRTTFAEPCEAAEASESEADDDSFIASEDSGVKTESECVPCLSY